MLKFLQLTVNSTEEKCTNFSNMFLTEGAGKKKTCQKSWNIVEERKLNNLYMWLFAENRKVTESDDSHTAERTHYCIWSSKYLSQ